MHRSGNLRSHTTQQVGRSESGFVARSTGPNWFGRQLGFGLDLDKSDGGAITINLPESMNFSSDYEMTVLYLMAIRRLAIKKPHKKQAHLAMVNFSGLMRISTSAALVLTAELSKWEDSIRQKLRPEINNWQFDILYKFYELGFFELFRNNPFEGTEAESSGSVQLVRYIKGRTGDTAMTRQLKAAIGKVVGDGIDKWVFLNTGLSEAITNVTHHAYNYEWFRSKDKTWYLTGSYNSESKELKIVFYDQGIGIPKSLPASDIWERALKYLSSFPSIERRRDATMLKAAVELSRTSTGEDDRGKGLQDLLEFVRQRNEGYLSILSLKGLYKFSIEGGRERVKSVHFSNPLYGTLIIWRTVLDA